MSRFDWDDGNREKCARRVPLHEIDDLIDDPRTLIAGDPYEGETRFSRDWQQFRGPSFVRGLHHVREKWRTPCSSDQRPLEASELGPVKKPFPKFDSDETLEAFLETADLDEYDLAAGALPRDEWFARYERFAKDASIHLRLPGRLLEAVRAQATKEGIPAQRLIREYIERGLRGRSEPERGLRARRR